MKVAIHANGDPANPVILEDWPSEWRLPTVGERIDIREVSSTVLEVSNVIWVKHRDPTTNGVFWGVQLWVWGPKLRTERT